MGYTTEFKGCFTFDKVMEQRHANYLRVFNRTRRMKRNPEIAVKMIDDVRNEAGLPIGEDGCFFVGSPENFGQNNDASVLDHNTAPGQIPYSQGSSYDSVWKENEKRVADGICQPGLWCQWTVSEDNTKLEWDGGEKFYNYIEWLRYIIKNFLDPWGYKINGTVKWTGEDRHDRGKIIVTENSIEVKSKVKI